MRFYSFSSKNCIIFIELAKLRDYSKSSESFDMYGVVFVHAEHDSQSIKPIRLY